MFTASLLLFLLPAPEPSGHSVKRVCVEKFAGGAHGLEAADYATAALFASKRFTITENCETAEAVLKGSAAERSGQRMRSEGDSSTVRRGAGAAAAGVAAVGAAAAGDSERLFSSEVQRQATVSLRLVSKEGEVIWAHTAGSSGGKAKSALNDAVDRAVRQLLRDLDKPPTAKASQSPR